MIEYLMVTICVLNAVACFKVTKGQNILVLALWYVLIFANIGYAIDIGLFLLNTSGTGLIETRPQ